MFPSLKSWIKAGLLFLSTYTTVVVINIYLWPLIFLAFFEPMFLQGVTLILILSLVVFVILRGLYALILRIFWSNPPKWIRAAPWRKTLIHWGICLLATLPLSILMFPHIAALANERAYAFIRSDIYKEIFVRDMLRSSWAWILTSAYLYQWCPWLDR